MRRQRTFIGPQGMSGMVGLWGAPSLIRSIQRGIISITSAASATATITAVVTDNCVIRLLGVNTGGASTYDLVPTIALTNSTTVTATRYSTAANATTASFEVIEYAPGVIKSVQRGTGTFAGASPLNVTITAVSDMTKTTVDFLGARFNTSSAFSLTVLPTVTLTSVTNVQGASTNPNTVEFNYQVTEWF